MPDAPPSPESLDAEESHRLLDELYAHLDRMRELLIGRGAWPGSECGAPNLAGVRLAIEARDRAQHLLAEMAILEISAGRQLARARAAVLYAGGG